MNDDSAFWAYLAGFTDGDGCITREMSKGRYTYARIRWSQKESDSAVLDVIAQFLAARGFKVTSRNFSVVTGGHKFPQRELGVRNAEDTRRILHELMPYLIVKRERAIEALAVMDHVRALKQQFGNKYRISTGTCTDADGCNQPFYARKLCKRHYDKRLRPDRKPLARPEADSAASK